MSSLDDAAAWLKEKIGVGGIFTKEELRAAFPGVTQIDRRVRDLRKCGWVIDTRREDRSLSRAEMRVVKIGNTSRPEGEVSPAVRRKALLAAAYSCVLCGAAGGTAYPDAQHIQVALQVVDPGGGRELIVCCGRCRADAKSIASIDNSAVTSASVAVATNLSPADWAAACRARIARRLL
jgi:hypothetical protein